MNVRMQVWKRRLTKAAGATLVAGLLAAAPGVPPPDVQRAAFRMLDGFEIQLFASELEGVINPIQLRFDPAGRLWVACSVTYPQPVPGVPADDRIVVLEDRDGDGRADRSTVFADGLQIPTGIELGDGGVYVGAATELLHLRDTNGDGKADERRVILSGFGTGDSHQTLNSFAWGPCGELLMSQGLHANSRVETPWGIAELRQAGVWRLWPRTLRLEAFWDGAMGAHNPFGNVFDRWGQPLVFAGNGHGVYHLTQAMIPTRHFLEQKSLWNQGRKFGGGDFVENAVWPKTLQGEVITGGYLHNSVERFRVTEDGATFRVERLPPLVETTDTSFRVVDVRFGPDGALYLCDWANPVIGHYQASFRDPDRDKTHGRIWRVQPKRPAGTPPARRDLSAGTVSELLDQLGSPDRWTRQMAARVLAGRPQSAVLEALGRRLDASPPPDEHPLFEWIGVMAGFGPVPLPVLDRLAGATRFEARAFAARVAGLSAAHRAAEDSGADLNPYLERLARLVADTHPRVRLEAVVACAQVPDARAIEVAALATDAAMEPAIEYAFTQCVQALKPWWRPALERGELTLGGVPARLTALTRADRSADTVAKAAGRLRRIAEVALEDSTRDELLQTVADAGGPNELAVLLSPRTFNRGAAPDPELHAMWLERLAVVSRNRGVRPSGDLGALLEPLLRSEAVGVRCGALRLVGLWQVDSQRSALERAAVAEALPEERQAAADGLTELADPASLRLLTRLAASDPEPEVRARAVAALVRRDPDAAARLAASAWSSPVTPDAVRVVLLAFLQQRDAVASLTRALDAAAPARSAAVTALELMASSGRRDPELAAVFEHAAGPGVPVSAWTESDRTALAAEVQTSGDRVRGAEIFRWPALGCTACHSVDGTPGLIGPSLGALGTSQTVEFVLGALLEPQKEVKEGFVAHEITTRRGETYQGYLRGETPGEVAILDHLSGGMIRLHPDQIESRRQLGSLMPEGLLDGLSRNEIRDLVAYLSQLGRE